MNIRLIFEFAAALAFLIIIHEWGHYIACRLVNVEVLEFGLGLPPRLKRIWRLKGWLRIGRHKVIIPQNFELPFDIDETRSHGVEAVASLDKKGQPVLKTITLAATEDGQYRAPLNDYMTQPNGEVRIAGVLHEGMRGTDITLNALPIGGFVLPKGETNADTYGGLASAAPWKRIFVAIAGPVMNIVFALALIMVMYGAYGEPVAIPDQIQIAGVDAASPAEAAGLKSCDTLVSLNGQPVHSYEDVSGIVSANLGQTVQMVYSRAGQELSASLTPRVDPPPGQGAMGVQISPTLRFDKLGAAQVLPVSLQMLGSMSSEVINLPVKMIRNQLSPQEGRIMGLKGMYDVYAGMRNGDLLACAPQSFNIMNFLLSLTISLGIFNLIPIPALDGGRIVLALPELIARRRLSPGYENFVNIITYVSFLLLLGLLLFVNVRDFISPVQFP